MILPEYSNSTNITHRTLAAQARPTVYIAQAPDGVWHWHKRTANGCGRSSKERFETEQEALEAAASIATTGGARLKVTPRQQVVIILYWMDCGRRAFAAGTPITLLGNRHMRSGWMWAAEDAAVYSEAESKPGLDCPDVVTLTIEEALELQERMNAERIDANYAVLAGVQS